MSPHQQRIAIAEFCGLTAYDDKPSYGFNTKGIACQIPDYVSDLNAMHEAEKCLKREQIRDYEIFLIQLLGLPLENTPYTGPTFPLIHATSDQRAEALLRTIGKWQERSIK